MNRARIPVALGLALALGSGARAASAEPLEDRRRTKQLLADGASFFDKGAYDKALDRFQAAYTIEPDPKILYDMAQCQMGLLRPTEAARNFHVFLLSTANDPSMAGSDYRRIAHDRLGKLEAQLGRLYISVTPADAQRVLDGHPADEPLQYVIAAPTTHTITVTARGYRPATQTLSVPAGQLQDLTLSLEPESGSPRLAASPTRNPAELALAAPAAGASEPNRMPAYLTGIGAALLASGALGLGLVTQSEYNALPENYSGHTTSAEANVTTHARITDVLWAASLITAGVGTYLWFTAAPSPGGGAGVAVGGAF